MIRNRNSLLKYNSEQNTKAKIWFIDSLHGEEKDSKFWLYNLFYRLIFDTLSISFEGGDYLMEIISNLLLDYSTLGTDTKESFSR